MRSLGQRWTFVVIAGMKLQAANLIPIFVLLLWTLVLLDTAALCSFPEDLSSACAWTRAVPRGMREVIPCHFICGLAELICCSCACRELASCEGIYHWRYADSKPSKKIMV